MLGSAIGYAMDGFDLLILGFMLHAISADLNLTPTQSGSLVTWTLIGAVAGGIIFGALSDRYGRVRVLTWTIVLFATFTGLCAFATGYWDLLIYRTIAGIGLGGEFGIGMALAAEAWPARHRSRVSSYVALGWQAGVLLAAVLTPMLLPFIGWRGMFIVGVIPALIAWFIRHRLHEPDVFVNQSAAEKTSMLESFRLLVKDKATTKISAGIAILTSVQNLGYYGIMIWMPAYLAKQLGFGLTKSAMWTTVTILGMMAGIWVFGQLADRIGRKPAFILFQAGAAVSIVFYAQLTDPLTMLWAGALLGMFVNGMLGGYGALISEAYPTAARATAQNVLFNIGRGVGGFGPVLIGAIAAMYSFHLAIALLASIYVIDIIATIFLIPELKGKELD
ncbi:TPA: MFS transporter [Klebsiella pneumoniae]|uniref:MFS transporter n=1 Tax=Klebsiella oxytoca TaxID=571 RepID=A0AAI9E3H1_KLEOX|nr:MFS transporter [Klebsiella oxytoca]EIX9735681.1 MFS transporter [Klebsiella pneumoniae]EKU3512272.1 MFS transporter [Klebsiella quasipneumoniae]EKW1878415.1 MFS transporter [Raoultella ornithinolytica]EKZ6233346.1 MFS transporter [Klebsiella variicola]ELO7627543.1 MFS transporter [Klebsiella michiganensis]MBM6489945.1 MFS transporter [Enterobacter hormaechei]MBO3690916.1 MFS transporter [Klebsiella quasipneumoniae subsp. similipneumoniae]HBS1998706.1 MFS transporter [Klebsiella quasipne